MTVHAPGHETCRQGVKNDHIFGIPVAILPIHYATFMGLRRWLDLGVGLIKSTQVNLGLPSRVKSVCSSVTVEIFWRHRSHYKSFQVDLRRRLNQ